MTVKCGRCLACKQKLQKEWSARLAIELENCNSAFFVTLTYSDDSLFNICKWGHKDAEVSYKFNNALGKDDFGSMIPKLNKHHLRGVLKDLRNFLSRGMPNYYLGKKVSLIPLKSENFKYFIIGEYGTKNNRPHWHALFFNIGLNKDDFYTLLRFVWSDKNELQDGKYYKSLGFIHIGEVSPSSIDYVTDYLLKNDKKETIRLISKGLGSAYITDEKIKYHSKALTDRVRVLNQFHVTGRYLKDKLLTKNEQKLINEKKHDKFLEEFMENPNLIQEQYNRLSNNVKFKLSKK